MNTTTQTAKLKDLPINSLILNEHSLDNIVEDNELCAILSNYATLSEINSKGYVTWSDITAYESGEQDPFFHEWKTNVSSIIERLRYFEPSTCLTREDLNGYLTAETDPVFARTSSNFQLTSQMNSYALTSWVTNNFVSQEASISSFVRKDSGQSNNIYSTNTFDGNEVKFKLQTNNFGPEIKLNTNLNFHMQVDNEAFVFPLRNPSSWSPSYGINNDDFVKTYTGTTGAQLSANILATREWTRKWTTDNFAAADQSFRLKLTDMFNECGMTKNITEENIDLRKVIKFIKLLCEEYGPDTITNSAS